MKKVHYNVGDILLKNTIKYAVIFMAGGILYYIIELLWRGYSHISMAVAGGICFIGIYAIEDRFGYIPLYLKAAAGATLITAVEFVFGCIVNKVMGLYIWDYSQRPFNIMGQVCLLYCILWYMLSIPAFMLCSVIKSFFEEKDKKDVAKKVKF